MPRSARQRHPKRRSGIYEVEVKPSEHVVEHLYYGRARDGRDARRKALKLARKDFDDPKVLKVRDVTKHAEDIPFEDEFAGMRGPPKRYGEDPASYKRRTGYDYKDRS